MTAKKSKTQVLIVGAGPTGLAAAANLARLGVSFRIIEKNQTPSDKSRALGVQAGTLEALKAYFGAGVSERLLTLGNPTRNAFLHLDEARPVRLDLSLIPSEFNYILILDQSRTEKTLEGLLPAGVRGVERGTELLSLTQHGSAGTAGAVVSVVRTPEGLNEEITSNFVIGADGAHSLVRKEAQLDFKGGAYKGDFLLADVDVEWPWGSEAMHVFVGGRGAIACFPFNKNKKFRLIGIQKNGSSVEEAASAPQGLLTLEEVEALARQIIKGPIKLSNPVWLARFRLHHRITQHFQNGCLFLAGDAAHIHSPVGGQGMNTGIQDALSLTTKIAQVLKGETNLGFLKTYEAERLPVARGVVHTTDFVFKMALLHEDGFAKFTRRYLLRHLINQKWVQRRALSAVSEVKVARRDLKRAGLSGQNSP